MEEHDRFCNCNECMAPWEQQMTYFPEGDVDDRDVDLEHPEWSGHFETRIK